MIYLRSDIHGFYQEYLYFLEYVKFSNKDRLYILGDTLNRGPDGIALIKDIMKRENMILIKGNHEHTMCEKFEEIINVGSEYEANQMIKESLILEPIGQESILHDFLNSSLEEKYEIINYLNSLSYYEEVTVDEKEYLLVHGGISG